MDGFPSGQRGQTVNLLQIASVVRIHLRPFYSTHTSVCVFFCFGNIDFFAKFYNYFIYLTKKYRHPLLHLTIKDNKIKVANYKQGVSLRPNDAMEADLCLQR